MKGLLIANGEIRQKEFYQERMKTEKYDLIVCADGGANNAYALGLMPQVIVGDMDSIKTDVRAYYENQGVDFHILPPAKDETDTEMALDYLLKAGCSSIDLFGCLGGRSDHAIGNIYLLVELAKKGAKARLVDEHNTLRVLLESETIDTKPGETISLIPLTEMVEEITLEGMTYPLNKETLYMGYSRGISNVALGDSISIRFSKGILLMVRVHESDEREE